VFRLLDRIDGTAGTIGVLLVGLLGGLVLAGIAEADRLTVTVDRSATTLSRLAKSFSRRIPRDAVQAVFMDGKKLVLLDQDGLELVRAQSDIKPEVLAEAFRRHGYPWRAEGDPHRTEFRLWVEDLPGLPTAADALLKARAKALAKGNQDDAEELRDELLRLGVVVREEKRRQYWRLASPPALDGG
jgi:hypothetical protein